MNELFSHLEGQVVFSRAGLGTLAKLGVNLLRQHKSFVFLVKDRESLRVADGLLQLFMPEFSAEKKPWVILPPFSTRSVGREGWSERIAAFHALQDGSVQGLLLTPDNLLLKWMPLNFFHGQELALKKGEEISSDMILEQALSWGYGKVSIVTNAGEIAQRGDVLDIMPPGYAFPLRFDFFDDSLESIKVFDPSTQRSKEELEEAIILPVHPIRQTSFKKIYARWERLLTKGLISVQEKQCMENLLEARDFQLLPGAVYDAATSLEEWLPKGCLWLLPGRNESEDILRSAEQNWTLALKKVGQRFAVRTTGQVLGFLEKVTRVHAEPLALGIEEEGIDLPERGLAHFSDLFPTNLDRPWQLLLKSLKSWQSSKRQVILSFGTERSRSKFLQLVEQDGLKPALRYNPNDSGLYAVVSPFRLGVDLVWDQTLILGEDVLQPQQQEHRQATGIFHGLERYDDLNVGDFIVHRDYGIARFGGMLRMKIGSISNDFLLLEYAGDDKLYLPVDRFSLIQRFKGEESPQLDKLGGSSWQAGKAKVQKAIEKIAQDIIEMYAWRKVAKGFQYPPLGDEYREFEASFSFEETPDQAKAIRDVLRDMEKPEPMDRLICGDVGFGKTEVALRAAFRAASEGRQVALLCPTTVLAEQHYQTFRSRLNKFAISVGLLSRFVPASKQKEVLKAAAACQIDVLIGTHRLLSNDVQLPHLALLILDEEQRFGVRHKEKLKQIKKNVDVLTLTATPIPRTLQLSMSGVRELSVIETAPVDRKAVKTAILQRDDKTTIKHILERELAREGQVFWVYNRIQGLDRVADYVRELMPQARIGIAHGKLAEKVLEETMLQFWHGEIDILVCTAIVESGLDFPRANTLIVDQAQIFGLAQLYQLRGRVGRSDRQAYAGFIVPDVKNLPKNVLERLQLILDLDYLGAGFQVAMEDLRLRGAGNILGEVQSGHMNRIGLDLYLEMLEEAVSKIRGDTVVIHTETEINLALTAYIPESYIADGQERLRWYKRLSSAQDAKERENLVLEIRDRFGRLPEELEVFLALLDLKQFLGSVQVVRADISSEHVCMIWNENQNAVDVNKIPIFLKKYSTRVQLKPPATLDFKLDTNLSLPSRLLEVEDIVRYLFLKSS